MEELEYSHDVKIEVIDLEDELNQFEMLIEFFVAQGAKRASFVALDRTLLSLF